jgi:site-specific recombinase XerD
VTPQRAGRPAPDQQSALVLLPAAVTDLLRPRRRLTARGSSDGVTETEVELTSSANAAELLAAGLTPLEQPARGATDAAFRWLLSFDSADTRRNYATDLRQFATWAIASGVDDVLKARRAVLDAYARYLAEEIEHVIDDGTGQPTTVRRPRLKQRSRARRLAALSSFYDYAAEEALIAANPARRVRRPVLTDADRDLSGLSAAQLATLLDTAENYGPREHALVSLLGLLGLRVSEATRVDIEQITEQAGKKGTHHVLAVTGKGGKTRKAALGPRAWAAVQQVIGGRTAGPLLRTSSGARMSTNQARTTLKVLAKRAGVGIDTDADGVITNVWLHPHTLRHTFVTLAREAGASLEDVQDAAGHDDPRTTRAYDTDREQLDRSPSYPLDQLIARAPRASGQR